MKKKEIFRLAIPSCSSQGARRQITGIDIKCPSLHASQIVFLQLEIELINTTRKISESKHLPNQLCM